MEYLKKHRFGTLYKGLFPNLYKVLVSISLSFRTSRWLLIQHWFCAALPLSEFFPPRISCHASCFSESVPNVSQSRFAIKRGKSLYFRLGRSRHSRNSPVHRSITRVRIQSAHSERKKHSSPQSKEMSINWSDPRSKSHPWEVHHVDRNRQRPSCTHPRGQHSWQSSLVSPEGMVWLCSWCCLIDVESRFSPSENLHLL